MLIDHKNLSNSYSSIPKSRILKTKKNLCIKKRSKAFYDIFGHFFPFKNDFIRNY